MAVSVDTIPNRNSPPTVLLREAWREGTRIRCRTLANVSKAPPEPVAGVRALVKGGVVVSGIDQVLNTCRSLPHGHVAATLGMAGELGLGEVRGNEMLSTLGWLRERQPWIERSLANRRLGEGSLLLHDVISSFFEGQACPLAVEVFAGNTADPLLFRRHVAHHGQRHPLSRALLILNGVSRADDIELVPFRDAPRFLATTQRQERRA
ncbi:MAG: hypothetical protein J4F97_05650 [Pseudomonadales bacterium]|nr:hypothetical protein [Pseudomonadales bacterium]